MSAQRIEREITEDGIRLDKYLASQVPGLSRSAIQRLIHEEQVTVNGELARASYKTRAGDVVIALLPGEASVELQPEPIPLDIVYEDDALLVVNKTPGMVVHPAPGHDRGTLVNAILAHVPGLAAVEPRESTAQRPGIVHRLDRDTSGLIVVAKNDRVQRLLQQQFKQREVKKGYLALLNGHLQPAWGCIEAPIGRDPRHRQRMAVLPGVREAMTEYHILEVFDHKIGPAAGQYTLVEAEPKTGRTHQIRVHFASIGHPLVGDEVYGRRRTRLPVPRQFLHAWRLTFKHPLTGQHLNLEAPLAPDLQETLDLLRSEK